MVNKVIFEELHKQYLSELSGQSGCIAGIILGQIQSNKDYIARLVRCPPQNDNMNGWLGVQHVEGSWIAGHAVQLIPCLPGGITIIGVFLIAPATESKLTSEKLKQSIYQTYRHVSRTKDTVFTDCANACEESLYWTAMHVDAKNGSLINCRQYDVKDNKDIGRPVELKPVDAPIQWDCCRTTIHIDQLYSANDSNTNRVDALKEIMKPFKLKIENACITIEQKQLHGGELLNPSSHSIKSTKKKKVSSKQHSRKVFSCQVFTSSSEACNPTFGEVHHIVGSITSKAFLAPNSTAADAITFLKQDIVQSIQQRCEILSEDSIESSNANQTVLLTFPRRVYISNDQNDTISFSEYILPNEPMDDCLERIKDNLDISIDADGLKEENSMEKFQTTEQNIHDLQKNCNDMDGVHESASKSNAIIALVATAVAFLGWMFSGLVINDN